MRTSLLLTSRKGFSILVALGTTGFLLILATGLASVFLSEMRINHMLYDGIIAYSAAEGGFEYAMLKTKNHRDGFEDKVTKDDLDSALLRGSLPRSLDVEMTYELESQSRDRTFSGVVGQHIIIPLFVGDDDTISTYSKKPTFSPRVKTLSDLTVSGLNDSTSWTILGMSGGTTMGITGTGNLTNTTIGTMRIRGVDCYDTNGDKIACNTTIGTIAEEIEYLYDSGITVENFLINPLITDRYLSIFNNSAVDLDAVRVVSTTGDFALPEYTLTTSGKIGRTSQSIRFTEDKSRYYDAIRYGLYNQ